MTVLTILKVWLMLSDSVVEMTNMQTALQNLVSEDLSHGALQMLYKE